VQEHEEEKVLDGKDGGANKDGDGDKMESKCFTHHRTLSISFRKCGLKNSGSCSIVQSDV